MSDCRVDLSANDLHVMTTQFLDAARSIHIAMCRFDADHTAQAYLNDAMHSALIGAEQCRQAHKNLARPAPAPAQGEG